MVLPKNGDVRKRESDDQALHIYIYIENGTALKYVQKQVTADIHLHRALVSFDKE